MAGVIKRNPLAAAQQWEQIGKQITWFTVSGTNIPPFVPGTPAAEYQIGWEADGAVNALMAVIQKTTTVIAMGPIVAGVVSIAVEGIFTDQVNFDGTAADGDLARMQADIQALGEVTGHVANGDDNTAGVDLSSASVTAKTFILA